MTTQPPIRVLIADDHHLFAEALGLTLQADARLEVVAYARNGKEAAELALTLRPDVVLMDLEMPVLDGVEATRSVRRALPDCQVAVLTASAVPEDALRARDAGAAAYLTKGCSARDVVEAVLELASPTDQHRKEVTNGGRGVREPRGSTARPAGLPHSLLQFRSSLAH
jgi:DNA-binding NarL/FixJ family response regulator